MSEATGRRGTTGSSQAASDAAGVSSNATPPAHPLPEIESRLIGQVEKWRDKLLDLGNRNPLINCSFNPSRGVIELLFPDCELIWRKLAADGAAGSDPMRFPWRRDLVPPPPDFQEESPASEGEETVSKKKEWNPPLEDCLASRRLRERDVLAGPGDRAMDRRLRTLDGYAHLSLSEQGVHCLYVAFGFLKWFEKADSEQELRSPLMLVPVALSRSSADAPWELTEAEDDAIDNLCLRQRLKQDFGLELPPLPEIDDLEEEGTRQAFLASMREAIADNPRWEVEDRCALGRFAFPKVAMWQDLGQHSDGVQAHPLCRSIAGDQGVPPQQAFGSAENLPEAARLDDEIPPGQVKAILDCDSSQLEAIVAARRGVSFVLDGPPGTGKSQTIANIIADSLSDGRTVLFVSEKVSALEVVKRRLDDCGLGDFCLECHSSKANRKAILAELKWCLEIEAEVYDDATPKLEEAKRRRSELNDYVRAIHRPRLPLGLSPFELYGQVVRLNRLGLSTRSRCELPDPSEVNRQTFDGWLHLFERATEIVDVIKGHETHPWRGCTLTSRSLSLSDDLNHHLGALSAAFLRVSEAAGPLVSEGLLAEELSPGTLNETVRALKDALTAPHVPATWFAAPEEVASTVLRRCEAGTEIEQCRMVLGDYLDDVEVRMAIRAGATDLEDFIRLIARELGFERTGKKIRERLEAVVNEEVHTGKLRRIGERIAPPSAGA